MASRTLSLSAWAALLCIISFSYGAAWCSEPGSCRSLSFRRCVPPRERVRLPVRALLFACRQPFPRASQFLPPVCPSSWPAVGSRTSYAGAFFDAPVVAVIAEAAATLLISAPFAPRVGVGAKHSRCAWQQNCRTIHTAPHHHHPPPIFCLLPKFFCEASWDSQIIPRCMTALPCAIPHSSFCLCARTQPHAHVYTCANTCMYKRLAWLLNCLHACGAIYW